MPEPVIDVEAELLNERPLTFGLVVMSIRMPLAPILEVDVVVVVVVVVLLATPVVVVAPLFEIRASL